jgi:hypothetical protein
MSESVPATVANAYRIVIELEQPESRMDNVLLNALRVHEENEKL